MNLKKSVVLFIALVVLTSPALTQPLLIIVNKSNKVENLSLKELKKIYKAEKKRWKNGKKITLSVLDLNSEEGKLFLKSVYKGSQNDYNKYWLKKVFRGEAQAPKKLKSASDVVIFVKNNPGGIGFVKSKKDLDISEVKVVKIDGKTAADDGYALR